LGGADGGRLARGVNPGHDIADLDGVALFSLDLQCAGFSRGEFGGGFVGFQFDHDIVRADIVAVRLDPPGNRRPADGFTQAGNFQFKQVTHSYLPSLLTATSTLDCAPDLASAPAARSASSGLASRISLEARLIPSAREMMSCCSISC